MKLFYNELIQLLPLNDRANYMNLRLKYFINVSVSLITYLLNWEGWNKVRLYFIHCAGLVVSDCNWHELALFQFFNNNCEITMITH